MPSRTLNSKDYHELRSLIIEWAWRFDRNGADTLHELMIDEPYLKLGREHKGMDAVVAWGKKRSNNFDGTARHVLTNIHFRVIDEGRVESTTLCQTFIHKGPGFGVPKPMMVGEYNDVFVRVGGVWKFASRTFDRLFWTPDD